MAFDKVNRRRRIKYRIRNKISGTPERPRLSVYKSNKFFYSQLIDDLNGKTLLAADSREIDEKKNCTVDISKELGIKLAEKAKASGIEAVVFDRSGYIYHGQVKAFAEGAREGGLKF